MEFIEENFNYEIISKTRSTLILKASLKEEPHKTYALKLLRRPSPQGHLELMEEGEFTRVLQHENIIKIDKVDREHGFIQMPYFPLSLRDLIKQKLAIELVIQMGLQICDALIYLHHFEYRDKKGFHHLDIKPENILFDKTNFYLIDFGIAREWETYATTYTDTIKGTNIFIPPEFIREGMVGPFTDVYALGITIKLALGLHPNSREMIKTIPPSLEKAIMDAEQKDYRKRIRSPEELKPYLELAIMELEAKRDPNIFLRELKRTIKRKEFIPSLHLIDLLHRTGYPEEEIFKLLIEVYQMNGNRRNAEEFCRRMLVHI